MADTSTAEERRTKYAVPALEKGLDIIELLADQGVPMTQAQVARALQRQPGEIFRMLTCLEGRGWLRRDAETGGYELTLRLFELSRTHSPYEELLKAALPHMRRLTEAVRESCHLSVLHRDQVLVLAQEESPRPFRLSVEVGSRHDPVHTTSGRVLLASLPQGGRDELLARLPSWRGLDAAGRKRIAARIAEAALHGWERSDGERFVGGMDLGVLVGSADSSVRAALTVAALKSADGPDLEAMLPTLASCAASIAADAGLISKGQRL